jgi:hypothetical protein
MWYPRVGSILSFLCDLLGFVCVPSNVYWNLRIINTLLATFYDIVKRFIYCFQHFFHNMILQSNIEFLHCLWDIVQRITGTFGRHPCQKICNNTLYTKSR